MQDLSNTGETTKDIKEVLHQNCLVGQKKEQYIHK